MNDYHTALRPDGADRPEAWRWTDGKNVALVHDVNLGLPEQMAACDGLYSELPWKDGYEEFLRRAGKPVGIALPYERWLFRLSATLIRGNVPFVMVAGHKAVRHMACEWVHPVDLNGSVSMALGVGVKPPPSSLRDAEELARWAVRRSVMIGDPCAGFGRTARLAWENGVPFVCSDINPRCIGTIARMMEGHDAG